MTIAVTITMGAGDQVLALVDMTYIPELHEVLYTARLQGNLYKGVELGPRATLRDALANAVDAIRELRGSNPNFKQ